MRIANIIEGIITILLGIAIGTFIFIACSFVDHVINNRYSLRANVSRLKTIEAVQQENLPLTNIAIEEAVSDGEITIGEYDKITNVYYDELRSKKIKEITNATNNR